MVEVGLNVNNREPLLIEEYTPDRMFETARKAEELGFDSVWVGDNLLEKPRLEPLTCLAKIAAITDSVTLGTSCMLTTLRHPVQFAQAWATLDVISGGRMLLGACMGEPTEENYRQHEMVGVPPKRRAVALEEGIQIMKALWRDGEVTFSGEQFDLDGVSFDTGMEAVPLRPVQDDPPVVVVSNPTLHGGEATNERAVRRIVDVGDGWMSCCRADHPGEFTAQRGAIRAYAEERGVDPDDLAISYQVTVNVADSVEAAERDMRDYIESYYPQHDIESEHLPDWGPMGPPEAIAGWIEEFSELGCDHFIVRFGAADQRGQLERFANEVLPAV